MNSKVSIKESGELGIGKIARVEQGPEAGRFEEGNAWQGHGLEEVEIDSITEA